MFPQLPPATKEVGSLGQDIAQLLECLSSVHEALDLNPSTHEINMVVQTCYPNTQEMEAEGSEFLGHP